MFRTIESYEENGLGLPYPIILKNAAEELLNEEGQRIGVRIPNLEGLAAAVVIVRCLEPLQLAGEEVRFIRRVLGLTQKELAKKLEISAAETISRWENNVDGAVGGYVEKLLRSLALIELRPQAPGVSADQRAIVNLHIVKRQQEEWPTMIAERITACDHLEWDLPKAA